MARRRRSGSKYTRGMGRRGGFGGVSGGLIDSGVQGVGVAALMKRFVGAPAGSLTGALSGAGYAFLTRKNVLGAALGGYVHDNIGNVGGAASSSGQAGYG